MVEPLSYVEVYWIGFGCGVVCFAACLSFYYQINKYKIVKKGE